MPSASVSDERLLAEVEDILKAVPTDPVTDVTNETLLWLGRAAAVVERCDPAKVALFQLHLNNFHGEGYQAQRGFRQIMVLLHQAHTDLRLRTGPTNIAFGVKRVFEYFDEIRKIVELATDEVLFVDPYLDAEFISRYLPNIQAGVAIRLLTSGKRLASLLPAVDLFSQQHGSAVDIRSTMELHDRFLFVDKTSCYLSGASFKDGPKNAGTIILQIRDGFKAMWDTYDSLWEAAKVQRE
jgi:hypothetical protein